MIFEKEVSINLYFLLNRMTVTIQKNTYGYFKNDLLSRIRLEPLQVIIPRDFDISLEEFKELSCFKELVFVAGDYKDYVENCIVQFYDEFISSKRRK